MAISQPIVEYREIPGFPGYRVGNDGSVWRLWVVCRSGRKLGNKWRLMKLGVQRKRSVGRSYFYVNLTPPEGGKYQTFRVHRLVLEAFVGPCPKGMETRHLDGNPQNNWLDNLAWGTQEENRRDNMTNEVYASGESHSQTKLTEDDVRAIRSRHVAGALQRELAEEFDISISNIHYIVRRKSWAHVS